MVQNNQITKQCTFNISLHSTCCRGDAYFTHITSARHCLDIGPVSSMLHQHLASAGSISRFGLVTPHALSELKVNMICEPDVALMLDHHL